MPGSNRVSCHQTGPEIMDDNLTLAHHSQYQFLFLYSHYQQDPPTRGKISSQCEETSYQVSWMFSLLKGYILFMDGVLCFKSPWAEGPCGDGLFLIPPNLIPSFNSPFLTPLFLSLLSSYFVPSFYFSPLSFPSL